MVRVIRVDEKGTLLACPLCDNEELTDDAYCMICGVRMQDLLDTWREGSKHDLPVHQGQ